VNGHSAGSLEDSQLGLSFFWGVGKWDASWTKKTTWRFNTGDIGVWHDAFPSVNKTWVYPSHFLVHRVRSCLNLSLHKFSQIWRVLVKTNEFLLHLSES
jgi:hypothetical protein